MIEHVVRGESMAENVMENVLCCWRDFPPPLESMLSTRVLGVLV